MNGRVGQHQRRRAGRRHQRSRRRRRRRGASWAWPASSRTCGASRGSARIATVGDPLGRSGRWLAGGDFTYATSRFRGDKNFLVGVWGLATDQQAGSDSTAYGVEGGLPERQVGHRAELQAHRPRLRSGARVRAAARPSSCSTSASTTARASPAGRSSNWSTSSAPSSRTDLTGRWESYRVFFAPINWRFRSGDRFEFNANPVGERLVAPFEVSDGVVIAPGTLPLAAISARGRHGPETAALHAGDVVVRRVLRRHASTRSIWTGAWNPTALCHNRVHRRAEHGAAAGGDFTQTLVGNRIRLNVSPDLSVSSYVQYDTISRLGRREHTPALDVQAGGRPVRRL